MSKVTAWAVALLLLSGIVASIGCSKSIATNTPSPDVLVVKVQQQDVPIYGEWIGTLDGMVNADIKAQVSGYLERQEYTEGSPVKKGQLLFQIDPRPFQAALDHARAQLAQANAQLLQAEAQVAVAEANQGRSQLDVERYTPLAKQQAVTQQDLDNAIQNNLAAKAQVAATRAQVETAKSQVQAALAAVDTAQLNLGFTRLVSPIDGVAGAAQLQVGTLVSPASGPVTTVSTLDPIKVYFTVSEQEYLAFHRRYSTPETLAAERQNLDFELILADRSIYPHHGKFYFADREVNARTGAIRLAAVFANNDNTLRPGQFAKVRFSTYTQQGALLIPQRAVAELQGSYQVAVVGSDNKVSLRPVKTGQRIESSWIIDEGLKAGELVVVEGLQKVRDGVQVNPKAFGAK